MERLPSCYRSLLGDFASSSWFAEPVFLTIACGALQITAPPRVLAILNQEKTSLAPGEARRQFSGLLFSLAVAVLNSWLFLPDFPTPPQAALPHCFRIMISPYDF